MSRSPAEFTAINQYFPKLFALRIGENVKEMFEWDMKIGYARSSGPEEDIRAMMS